MEFILEYWAVLLIALILILLVFLAYLIDKETKKIGNKKSFFKIKEKKEVNEVVVQDEGLEELDYDELNVEDIDDDFNKVIKKKKIMKDDFKNSIDSMKLDPIKFTKLGYSSNIELPDIKIKKEDPENVWGK